MDIVVIGLGYVGIANAISLAKKGHNVLAFDLNKERIETYIKGDSPLSEPDVAHYIRRYRNRIDFTSDPNKAYSFSSIYLIAVDTPSLETGESDLTHLNETIEMIKKENNKEGTIIIRSTVPLGTAASLKAQLPQYRIISNPEFLAGGSAIRDELFPMRIVVGASSVEEFNFMRTIYKKDIASGAPYYETTNISAELSKYASNSFLATKISFINSLSRLSDEIGADIDIVSSIMGADPRIGSSMLKAGVGFGGSCFKKDSESLLHVAKNNGVSLPLVEDALKINESQPLYLIEKIRKEVGSLKGKKISLLGLSYKGNCSDLRSAKSIDLVNELIKDEADITAYDPYEDARSKFKELFPNVDVKEAIRDAIKDAEILLISNDNKSFKNMNEEALLKLMKGRLIFDGRNLYQKNYFKYFKYISIGRTGKDK
ncbi:MAG: UDP-glucose/GDP-mannose dehydrogenase family protein [Bacilli bacterium]|nr:UDP-glucose/GDP-mannose dehydrogenase family protein [Bacilli bacterium]